MLESGSLFLLLLSCSQLISDIRHTPAVAAFLIPSVSALFGFALFGWVSGVSFRLLFLVSSRLDFPGGFSPGSFPLGIPKVQRNANLVDLENPCKMRLFSLS